MTLKTKPAAPVLDIKSITDDGAFSGYLSIFNNMDSYREIVVPGAFQKSLAEHRRRGTWPRMFWQHDPSKPIGSWTDLSEDGKGLYAEGQFNMEIQQAREARALLKAGDIDGLSIGYREIEIEPDEDKNATRLIELDLREGSVVSLQANDRCRVDYVKSEADELEASKWTKFADWVRRVADEENPPPNEFEEILRDAGASKSQRARIASRMHAVLRSESGGDEASTTVVERLRAAAAAFSPR